MLEEVPTDRAWDSLGPLQVMRARLSAFVHRAKRLTVRSKMWFEQIRPSRFGNCPCGDASLLSV